MRTAYIVSFIIFICIIIAVAIGAIQKDTANSFFRSFGNKSSKNNRRIRRYYNKRVSSQNNNQRNNPVNTIENRKKQRWRYIALIIDDVGLRNNYNLLSCKRVLNLSVLPCSKYSKIWVKKINKINRHELLIHIPMAAYTNKHSGIRSGMKSKTMYSLLKKYKKILSHAKGANNHQGSFATGSNNIMRRFFRQFRKFNLYFVDSMTNLKSVAYQEAKRAKVNALRRDVFLDVRRDRLFIRKRFLSGIRIAVKKGYAVLIGHAPSRHIFSLLISMKDIFRRNRIKFVKVSDLLKLRLKWRR